MSVNYGELAHDSLDSFVVTVAEIIKKNKFDLLLAGGDSGNIMMWIVKEVYRQLGQDLPYTVVLPIYRHVDEAETILFDNRKLKYLIDQSKVSNLQGVLIVDDEVGEGNTIKGILSALNEASDSKPKVTFIAENEDFDPASVSGWDIDFHVPKTRAEDVFNAISYIIPAEFETPVRRVLATEINELVDKQIMATLLNLPIKTWRDGNPRFTNRYIDLCKNKIKGFNDLQAGFQGYMKQEIQNTLS